MAKHIVKQGECIFSIAAAAGLPWERIWNDAANRTLVEKRKTPSILKPGDVVVVPKRQLKEEPGATEQRHTFRKKTQWVRLRISIWEFDEPRANEPYYILVKDRRYDGMEPTTNDEGLVECRLPAEAETAIIVLGSEDSREEIEVLLGHIDPLDSPEGIHTRLQNLGFYKGGIDTEYDDESKEALSEFLTSMGQEEPRVDDPDDKENQNVLNDVYGS